MMLTTTKPILTSKSVLKIASVVFGYAFWLILAQNQDLQITQTIPLSVYLANDELKLSGPEHITVGLLGKRLYLQKLDFQTIGAHIDGTNLNTAGTYPIQISTSHIFLPNYVKLLYYTPVIINLELS